MQLSTNFTLAELTKTNVRGADNTPSPTVIANLRDVALHILQPVRNHYGAPVIVNSGYRSPAVNAAVGGSKSSQHMTGEAVDFEVVGLSNYELAKWVSQNLIADQIILECYKPGGDPNAGWVHCSFRSGGPNRREVKTFDGSRYLNGLVA